MFRPPPGVVLGVKKLVWPARLSGEKPLTLFELRAGNVQDLLPPTVHPGTGKPYIWLTPPNSEFPLLPEALLELWQHWDSYRKELEAMCPWAKHGFNPEPAPRGAGARPNVIAAFNQAHSVEELLQAHGYKQRGKRWMAPTSSSGLAGTVILEGKVYSHHASDPLADGHAHDAFHLYRILNHNRDARSAVKAAAEELGMAGCGDRHGNVEDATDNATAQDILTIRYEPGKLPKNLDEAETALLIQAGVYQRGSLLVRVARIPQARVTRSVRRHEGALTIIPLDKATLVELLTSAARWEALNQKTKEYRAINCPKTIAEGLLARVGNWRFPVLAGIAEAPGVD